MKLRKFSKTIICLAAVLVLASCSGDERLPRTFEVNFVTGETASDIATQTIKEGYSISGITTPSNTRKSIFEGWFLDAEYTQEFDIDTYRVFEDITLYAKWTYPSTQPQAIKLGSDAFTRSITWIQEGVTDSASVKVQAYAGQLDYSYEYNENYDKNVIAGTKVKYETVLTDVPGTITVKDEYVVTYTLDNPTTDYYWFVISSPTSSFEAGEAKDLHFKGEGTIDKPYLVYNATDLQYLTTHSFDKNTYAEIKSDITLMSVYSEKVGCVFDGHLTGNKSNALIKTDENYTITLKNNSGLFHTIGENAVIENVTLNGSLYGSNPSMGVLANYNYGTLKRINSKAVSINSQGGRVNDITSLSLGGVGGIVGTNYGTITNCTVSSVRDNVIQGHIGVGGIAGINYGKISDMRVDAIIGAYNGNEISLTINNSFAGCVVGVNYGEVSYIDVYNGKVNVRRLDDGAMGEGATNIGGVVGYNATEGTIYNCLFDGMRIVGDTNVGGIAGYNDGTIKACYTGRRLRKPSNTVLAERQFISPVIGAYNVGGIAGKCGENSHITNVYSTANVWAYRNKGYSIAERADNSIGISCNQNMRTSQTWLGLKYGVVYSDDLLAPEGHRNVTIDNKYIQGLSQNNALGYVFNDAGEYVKDMKLVESYLKVLGSDFGFRESSSHGIRLCFESSVVPLEELVIEG